MNFNKSTRVAVAIAVAASGVLSGCAAERVPEVGPSERQTFASIAEARQSVSAVVQCDEAPTTEPIVNPDLAGFTAEYAVCGNRVQVEWFNTMDARLEAASVYMDSSQPLAFVQGENWIVADLSAALEETWSGKDLKKLAQELGGTYTELNGFDQS